MPFISKLGGKSIKGFGSLNSQFYIENSVRFRRSVNPYLSRTPTTASNRTTWTWSCWIKRGKLGANTLLSGGTTNLQGLTLSFNATDNLQVSTLGGATNLVSSAVFRDTSAWYNVIMTLDTTNSVAANRMSIYVNDKLLTDFSTSNYPTQNFQFGINNTETQAIGSTSTLGTNVFDGYMAEINFVDGIALSADYFGTINDLLQWVPKSYNNGNYGTNGYSLKFAEPVVVADFGRDSVSGTNLWTANMFSLNNDYTYDSVDDSPSSYNSASSNYCNLNQLRQASSGQGNVTDANTRLIGTSVVTNAANSSIRIPSFKQWYWEITIQAIAVANIGIVNSTTQSDLSSGCITYNNDGTKNVGGVNSAYGATYTTNDVIGVAIDLLADTLTFFKNGASQGSIAIGSLANNDLWSYLRTVGASTLYANFGQQTFRHTPPTNHLAINTFNLPTPTIARSTNQMEAVRYIGDGSSTTVGTRFRPSILWIKSRSANNSHVLANTFVNNGSAYLSTDTTAIETTDPNVVATINQAGFTVGSSSLTNANNSNYIAWVWEVGSSLVTNTSGSITSQVAANPTAGVSIVFYTSAGAATVGHGLGVAPSLIIIKERNNVDNWIVGHNSLTNWQSVLQLNTTSAAISNTIYFDGTAPTSTVFSIGSWGSTYGLVAYCFANTRSFSSIASYSGNGSTDGPFVYTEFAPAFLMIKRSDSTGDWVILDSNRNPHNPVGSELYANLNSAEVTAVDVDFLANGFKIRTSSSNLNANGGSYVYAAFAQFPFRYATAK